MISLAKNMFQKKKIENRIGQRNENVSVLSSDKLAEFFSNARL